MWTLRGAAASPFVRKVRIAASVCGLADRIDVAASRHDGRGRSAATGEPARQDPGARPRGRDRALQFARDRGIPRRRGRRRRDPSRRRHGALPCAHAAGACRRDHGCLGAQGLRGALARSRNAGTPAGSTIRRARWNADSPFWRPRRRKSQRDRMSDRSRSPARSAISTSASGGEWRKSYPGIVAWLDAFAGKVPTFDATRPG